VNTSAGSSHFIGRSTGSIGSSIAASSDDGSLTSVADSSIVGVGFVNDAVAQELCRQYASLANQKREVKKLLKKFDDDFVAANGRAPKKADKEVCLDC
jgi:hypothetical protein